jgi:hypothetical protein
MYVKYKTYKNTFIITIDLFTRWSTTYYSLGYNSMQKYILNKFDEQ